MKRKFEDHEQALRPAIRSPSFQDSFSKYCCEFERENYELRAKIKELEEKWMRSQEDAINKEIKMMSDYQEKEKRMSEEVERAEKKCSELGWRIDALQKENAGLVKEIQRRVDRKDGFLGEGSEEIESFELGNRMRVLECELEHVRNEKKSKVIGYKKKIAGLEAILTQVVMEKDRKIEELKARCKEVGKKFKTKSPLRSGIMTSRRESSCKMKEIGNMIAVLEKSQAEFKQRYIQLQKSKGASFNEITHLFDLLKNNEKKLKEARKLKENLLC